MTRAYIAWSSGKDSAFALHTIRLARQVEVVGALTTVTEPFDRVSMHGVRRSILEAQAAAAGLPLLTVDLPNPCSNADYETRMAAAVAHMQANGVEAVVFGDLFLADIRAYREAQMAAVGMQAVFPLWGRPTADLAVEIVASGIEARIVCLDPARLDVGFAGRRYDAALLNALPAAVDPCGENGEFHTLITDGPMFDKPLSVREGETVERDGFVFTDFQPQ